MSQRQLIILATPKRGGSQPLFPIKALPDRFIVQFPEIEDDFVVLESGLAVPGMANATDADRRIATVIDIGVPTDRAGEVLAEILKPGMRVIADRDYGDPFEWEGETYHIFRNFALTGYLPEEAPE
jgi:co-chaperonin GroES (HSP10)